MVYNADLDDLLCLIIFDWFYISNQSGGFNCVDTIIHAFIKVLSAK